MPLAPQITNTPTTIVPITFAISGVSYTSSTATYSVAGHTFNIGDVIIVSDVAPAGYNGTFTVASVVAGSTVTVSNATNTPVTVSTGTAWQAPTGFDASDNGVVFITDTTDPAGITTFRQGTTPTAIEIGDLWYDTSNGNRESRWDGSSWVLVQDTSIATALANANVAISNAAAAQAAATNAYNTAINSLQPSAYAIQNPTTKQLSSIDATGLTIFVNSATSGARVVMNSLGIAAYNSGGTATFTLTAGSGSINMTGAIITSGSITGTTLNVAGQFTVDAAGNMIANSATITGTIYATAGTFTGTVTTASLHATGGTVGGFTIAASSLSTAGLFFDGSAGTISSSGSILSGGLLNAQANLSVVGTGTFGGYIAPNSDNSVYCGLSSKRWIAVYAVNGTIQTSDARLKRDIEPSALGLEFINSLIPVSYKWFEGGQKIERDEKGKPIQDPDGNFHTTPIIGKRTHFGFLAQDVKSAIDKSGVDDFAGWVLDDTTNPDSGQSLAYHEFFAPIVKAIQELTTRVEELERGK